MKRLIPVLFPLLAGCATILASDSETIRIDSEPQGQTVAVDGSRYTTPALVTLGRDADHHATFPDGQTVYIKRTFQPWFLGNILLGGIPGMIIDLVTGAVNRDLWPDRLVYRDGKVYAGAKVVPPAGETKRDETKKPQPRYSE